MKQLLLLVVALGALSGQAAWAGCDESVAKSCLYIAAPPTPEELRKRQQEEQVRREEARREQQQVDEELVRRGWPKSREAEVRRFFELKKTAAAAGPRAGAGSALQPAAPTPDAAQKKPEIQRQAFPETIMVCTTPTGPNRRFECRSPVTVQHGHRQDISGHRSPEEMVAASSAGCPSPRRLPSTTHLVWGCGFGATNNSNSMDRSAGVDVQGRNTYYCTPRETSCRRISP